jgi:intein/homing endonuclease
MYEQLLNNPELAKLAGYITGDGHLQIKNWRYLTSFFSKDIEEVEAFESISQNLFNITPKRYEDRRKTWKGSGLRYQCFIISKPVALFLQKYEIPVGNKTNSPFLIPSWILNGSNEVKTAYLRALYDNEGTIFSCKERWQIVFRMAKNKILLKEGIAFFEQIREILKSLDIRTSPVNYGKLNIRKDGSTSMYLRITIEKPSFGNFLKHVGFDNKSKQEKLLKSLRASGQAAKIGSDF